MIPTSAHSGDGMGSLIAMIIEKCQTSLAKRLSYTDELQATVMEVSYFSNYKEDKKIFYLFLGKSNWWSWYNN
jgi:hypothetical protein